ncbi:methyltransferase domain-containing protein [Kineococcus rhizosphaerae]|uniref:Methyltransferase family protein n=1 Tax=Kineococcus rhizosphaerae TaxID=559628 RepID=A0A2T0QXY9_9ACTN|nr:methyltransferase domain-containing protein [Kineococcus rhizosphaerae]PRY11057.1 methyltransferase family protein [Kineococcus rhizosphaerae]
MRTGTRSRRALVADTLGGALAAPGQAPLRVLDAGGGDGRDAVELARLGHDVTVLDSSGRALAAAQERAAEAGVAHLVRTVDADLDDVAALAAITHHRAGGSGSFDLVLCHDVLPARGTLAQVVADVAALTSSVHAGGAISLLAPVGAPAAPGLLRLDRDLVRGALLASGCDLLDVGGDVVDEVTGVSHWHLVARRRGD